MKVRHAVLADIDRLVMYGEKFWEGTYFRQDRKMDYDGASVENLCRNLITVPDAGFILVMVDDEDEVKGFGLVAQYPFLFHMSVKMSGELAFYIDADYRGGGDAVKLMKAMETCARNRDVRFLSMISMEHSMDVGALYEKLGYTKTETSYTKDLQTW